MFRMSKHGDPKGFTFVKDQAFDIKVVYEESDQISEVALIITDEEGILDGNTISKV